jgi:drug/metabolite transporter (DMT)-like permease
LLAQLLVLAAALCYSASGLFGRRVKGINPTVTSAVSLATAAVATFPFVLAIDEPWALSLPSANVIWAMAAFAFVSTAFAYSVFYRLLGRIGATNLMLVTFLVPVSAILLGAVFLDEKLSWNEFAGMALIATGLVAIDGRLARRIGQTLSAPFRPSRGSA